MDGLWWKTPIKMDDLGVPFFLETPMYEDAKMASWNQPHNWSIRSIRKRWWFTNGNGNFSRDVKGSWNCSCCMTNKWLASMYHLLKKMLVEENVPNLFLWGGKRMTWPLPRVSFVILDVNFGLPSQKLGGKNWWVIFYAFRHSNCWMWAGLIWGFRRFTQFITDKLRVSDVMFLTCLMFFSDILISWYPKMQGKQRHSVTLQRWWFGKGSSF